MNKKLLAMLLAVAMIASLAVVPAAAAEKFPDAVGNWAESSIDRWADAGVVQGDTNGNINPSQFLTRAELATILVRLLGLTEKADAATFSDVAEGDWFADAVLKCAAAKIMLGDGEGHANPNDPITREQAITMVGRALGVKPQSGHSLERFVDADKVSAYAEKYMTPLTAMGILAGVGDGSRVAPQDTIDRASALALLDKAIAHYVTTPGEVKADNANAFVVVNVTDADAADVTVSGETAGVLVTTGNTADVKLKGLNADTVKVDAPVDVNVDGASKLGSVDVNAAANVDSKGVIGDLQLNDADATTNVTTTPGGNTGSTGGSYRPGRPSRKKNVADAEVLFITNADEYKAFFGEDMPTDHNIQLPWLVVSYTRNVAGTVTFSITKDGETVQFGTVAEGATEATLTDTLSSEFDASNENAYLSVHLYSQLDTDHKGQTWLNQTNAGGSYVATVELDGDEAVSDAATYVDKTALTDAIAAATEAAEAAIVDTDAANVDADKKWVTEADKKAYTDAIAAAQAVADKADATQADLDKAVTDLAAATETFEAAKQDGTKPVVTPTPEVDKTALTAAIADAKAAVEAVKTSTDGADVDPAEKWVTTEAKTAYQTAITTAEGVANKTDATQTEVDAAVAALAEATTTFENAKQDGTKVTKYTITKAAATNGSFTVKVGDAEVTEAAAAVTVTVTPAAESGYEVDAVTVKDADNADVTVNEGTDNYTFEMPAKDVTVTVTFKAVTVPAEASTTTFATMSDTVYAACNWAGKPAKDALTFTPDATTATTIKVTGTLNYAEDFTGFNGTKPEEQEGYYVFFQMAVPTEGQTAGVITLKNAESGAADKVYNTGDAGVLDQDGANKVFATIWHITDKTAAPQIEIDWDGEGTAYTATTYTLDFSGVTLAAKPVTPADIDVVPANLGEEQNSAATSALATGYTATATVGEGENTYNITVHADTLKAHKRNGQTDTEDQCWIGVGLPQIDFSSNSLFVTKDGTTWTQVGGNQITLNEVAYSMTYTVLTAEEKTKTLTYKVTADTPAANEGEEGTANPDGAAIVTYVVTYEATTLEGLPTPVVVDKTTLNNAITAANAAAEAITVDTDAANVAEGTKWVTVAEKTAYTDAIAEAQAVADKADATQDEVDAAVTALETATNTFNTAKKDGTKTETVEVDKTALTAAVEAAKTAIAAVKTSTDGSDVDPSEKWVTTEAQTAYQTAITTAEGVVNKTDATQTEVDDAVTALATATTTFENAQKDGTKTETTEVDKTTLTEAIAAAKTALAAVKTSTDGSDVDPSEKWVTTEAQTAYQTAITTAEGVANKTDATQTEVDDAVTALATATTTFENAKQDGTKVTKYTVNSATPENGTFTVKVGDTVVTEAAEGDTVTVTPTAAEGYEVDTVSYNDGTDHTVTADAETGAYTFTMPAAEVTVTVTFKAVYKVTISDTIANGTVTADKATAAAGETVTLTVTPDEGYELTAVQLRDADNGKVPGGATQGDTAATWTFTMPAKGVTVNAFFNLAPVDASDKFVVANLGNEANSGTDSQLAKNYKITSATQTAENTYEVYVYAESLTAHLSSDPTEAERGKLFYIGVGLPEVADGTSVYVCTDGATWNKVKIFPATVNGTAYSMVYAELSESVMELTVEYKVTSNKEDGSGDPDGAALVTYTVTFAADTLVPATTEVTP